MFIFASRARRPDPRLTPCALGVLLLCGPAAYAQGTDGPTLRFSGYGTVGAAYSSEKDADFVSHIEQPTGAGHTRRVNFNGDSRLGGQVDARFNSRLSAGAQVMSRYRDDSSYKPDLMSAFLRWQPTSTVSVRAGRMTLPLFLISDYRTVGYAQTQIRPPVEMYHTFPNYHYDGGEVTWTQGFDRLVIKTQLFAGRSKVKFPYGSGNALELDAKALYGLSVRGDTGDWTVRASYLHARQSTTSPATDRALNAVRFGLPPGALFPGSPALPADPALADDYDARDKSIPYVSLGLSYDPGTWSVAAEAAYNGRAGFASAGVYGYVTAAYRFDNIQPYISWARTYRSTGDATSNPIINELRTGGTNMSQSTVSLGARWDVVHNVALKTQIDRVRPDNGLPGQLINTQSGYQPGARYTVGSVAVDFVF